jgi:hypothetical protein
MIYFLTFIFYALIHDLFFCENNMRKQSHDPFFFVTTLGIS